MTVTNNGATSLATPSNDGAVGVLTAAPYTCSVTIEGTTAILFHRWSCEDVAEKAAAAKGSKMKKTDNVESYVYRDGKGVICLPGVYLLGALTDPRNGAAKYRQDPRSPRKSALDLYRAGVAILTELAPVTRVAGGTAKTWDYLDQRRVTVQRAGITRVRPAFLAGWKATFEVMVTTPEYIEPAALNSALVDAGRLVGVGDFRPTYGRFNIVHFEVA